MPNLPSFVFVLMKTIYEYVQKLTVKNGGAAPSAPNPNGANGLVKNKSNLSISQQSTGLSASSASVNSSGHTFTSIEELDDVRSSEISHKAVSGLLLIMLKWFRISRKRHQMLLLRTRLICNRCLKIRILNTASP